MWGPQEKEIQPNGTIHASEKRERKEGVRIRGRWGPPRNREPTIIDRAWRSPFGTFVNLTI